MGFRGNRGVNPLSCSTTLKACTDQKRRKACPMKDTELVICCCVFICYLHKIMLFFVHDTCSLSFCVIILCHSFWWPRTLQKLLKYTSDNWVIWDLYVRPNLVQRQCKLKSLRYWQDAIQRVKLHVLLRLFMTSRGRQISAVWKTSWKLQAFQWTCFETLEKSSYVSLFSGIDTF